MCFYALSYRFVWLFHRFLTKKGQKNVVLLILNAIINAEKLSLAWLIS